MPRLIDSGINRTSQVLNKGAVNSLIDLSDSKILIYNQFRSACHLYGPPVHFFLS